jgi:hypothetical protein
MLLLLCIYLFVIGSLEERMSSIIVGLDNIVEGSIIQYILRPAQQPTDPNKQWRGRVEMVTRNADLGLCYVRSIEPGYEGLGEYVFFKQIVSVEEYREDHSETN